MVTLRPIFAALGYADAQQQRNLLKLLEKTGCLGMMRPADAAVLSDAAADGLLEQIQFKEPTDALYWLHQVTQAQWLRPEGCERWQVQDSPVLVAQRDQLMPLLETLDQAAPAMPQHTHYDHVLILGATEGSVQKRLETLLALACAGKVTFGDVSLLGCQRPLISDEKSTAYEPSCKIVDLIGDNTETGMMIAHWKALQPALPPCLRDKDVQMVDTPNYPDGSRANTSDTVASWLSTNPKPGRVLVISNQPHLTYQHAAVESVLPDAFDIETIGAGIETPPLSVMLDSIAREIDVSLPRIRDRLQRQALYANLETVHMIPLKAISTNAKELQYRSNCDAHGETKEHRIDGERNPLLHGQPVLLYARCNGELQMLDGNHRLAFAKREAEAGRGPKELAARILFEYDGITPVEARAIGAYANLARECAPDKTPTEKELVDAARVFHLVHKGEVRDSILPRIPIKGALADAYQAGKLVLPAFGYVERGEVPVAMAAEVAERAHGNPDTEVMVMSMLANACRGQTAVSSL